MKDKVKKAISVLEVNKLLSSRQTEFCECADIAIKALEMQYKMIEHCEGACTACPYYNPNFGEHCLNDFIININ